MKDHQKKVESTFKADMDGGSEHDISESLSQLLDDLADENQHLMFSELTEREIKHLSVIKTAGYNDETTKRFIKQYMTMKISKKRRGREELVKIAESFGDMFQMENEGRMDKLKNFMGV